MDEEDYQIDMGDSEFKEFKRLMSKPVMKTPKAAASKKTAAKQVMKKKLLLP